MSRRKKASSDRDVKADPRFRQFGEVHTFVYANVAEALVDAPDGRKNDGTFKTCWRCGDYGSDTAAADAAMLNGTPNPDALARVGAARSRLPVLSLPARRRTFGRGTEGFAPLVDRYIEGRADHWQTRNRTAAAPVIRILAQITAPGYWEAQQFAERGAVYASIVDAVRGAGYRVELTAARMGTFGPTGSTPWIFGVDLSEATGRGADVSQLAAWLAGPTLARNVLIPASDTYRPFSQHGSGLSITDDTSAEASAEYRAMGFDVCLHYSEARPAREIFALVAEQLSAATGETVTVQAAA